MLEKFKTVTTKVCIVVFLYCGVFHSCRLFVVRGKPEDVFPQLFNKWKITKLTYEYDTEPYSLSRDKKVAALAKENGVEVIYKISHTLYDIDRYSINHAEQCFRSLKTDYMILMVDIYFLSCLHRIIEENNGKTPLTYNRLQAIMKTLGPPKRPIPAPTMEDMEGSQLPEILDDAIESS